MSELLYAIDVNSDWGTDRLASAIERHDPAHVILHSYHNYERASARAIMEQQPSVVQRQGKTVGYYVWAFQSYAPERTVRESVDRFRQSAGHDVPVGWVDCETYPGGSDPGPDVDWMHRAGAVFDELGIRKGIYTSPSWATERWGARTWELSDWLLWLADWGPPTVAALTSPYLPFYGWSELAAKQWAVRLPGDEEIDRDVILSGYTVPADAGGGQEPDKDAIIEGLRIALDDVVRDRMGARLDALQTDVDELRAALAEARRIRVQFLGEE